MAAETVRNSRREMIGKRRHLDRGRTMAKPMFVVIGLLLIFVAAALFFGMLESTQGVNLPIADQASDAETRPIATIEIPLSWGRDLTTAKNRLGVIYEALAKERKTPMGAKPAGAITRTTRFLHISNQPDDESYSTLALRIDRNVKYRVLVEAILRGRDKGYWRYQIACRKGAINSDVQYLILKLPAGPLPPPRAVLRLKVTLDGDATDYVLQGTVGRLGLPSPDLVFNDGDRIPGLPRKQPKRETGRFENLAEVVAALERVVKANAPVLLIIDPPNEMSIQGFVDIFNAAKKAGVHRIALSKPRE